MIVSVAALRPGEADALDDTDAGNGTGTGSTRPARGTALPPCRGPRLGPVHSRTGSVPDPFRTWSKASCRPGARC
ncbi:hypothetical protein ABIA38_002187 [Embleya sp. AB8]